MKILQCLDEKTINLFSNFLKPVNKILTKFHLIILRKSAYDELVQVHDIGFKCINNYSKLYKIDSKYPAECIIFSKDRAIQLHALLSSYFELVKNPVPVYILYTTSSNDHQKAYEEIFSIFRNHEITAIYQEKKESFKSQLMSILNSIRSEKVFFLVDDIIFKEDLDILDFIKSDIRTTIVSLRLGANLKKAYTTKKDQILPRFIDFNDKDKLCWIWKNEDLDWSYPLSVDGHLFSTSEIITFAENINFNSPNTFEANLQVYSPYINNRYGVCYKKSKILNIPINKVQDDNNNIHGNIHQDYLLEQWNRGMQIDYRRIYGFNNQSSQQEVTINFVKRE